MYRGRHTKGEDFGVSLVIKSLDFMLGYLQKLFVMCF